jgi:hypothetical protein
MAENKGEPLYEEDYKGTTLDACIVSTQRLTHFGVLHIDDMLGYLWPIVLHIVAQVAQIILSLGVYYEVERLEDPFESSQTDIATSVLTSHMGKPLDNNILIEKAAKKTCIALDDDLCTIHVLFMVVLSAAVFNEMLKSLRRVKAIVGLPSTRPYNDLEDEDEDDGCRGCLDTDDGEPDDMSAMFPNLTNWQAFSLRNWVGKASNVVHMCKPFKISLALTVLIPHILVNVVILWIGLKTVAYTFKPTKVALQALKLSFLTGILSQYGNCFQSYNMKHYLAGGCYQGPPETEDEEDDEKEDKCDFEYMWNAWGNTITKLVFAVVFTLIVRKTTFSGVDLMHSKCDAWEESLTLEQQISQGMTVDVAADGARRSLVQILLW